jgi:hypothetical protein
MRLNVARDIPVLLLLATCALVMATGCWRNTARPTPPQGAGVTPAPPAPQNAPKTTAITPPATPAVFVGSAACSGCHPAEEKTQGHSRHALTLFPMSRRALGKFAPPAGPIPGSGFMVQGRGDRFLIAANAQPDLAVPLDFAFGSGKTGMTYVFVPDQTRLIEMRFSYFPHRKQWYTTPGQERLPAQDVGSPFPQQVARECFACHSVTVAANAVTPQQPFYGVGCEACHGPGSAHIAAMRTGKHTADRQMEPMARWPATRLNALCGRCHGTEQEAQSQPGDVVRLQTVGLMRSQCFQQSRDTLSCITCHDPHKDVGTDAAAYEAVCLQCHSTTASARRPAPLRGAAIKSCPVNPRNRCIECHMPKRPAIAGAAVAPLMADHQIRVFAGGR